MSAVMFDADFVSVLMMPPPPVANYDLNDPKQAANYHKLSAEYLAVKQTTAAEATRSNILISAVVWYELQAFAFPDGTTLASRLAGHMKILVEEIDVSAVNLAGELIRELRAHPTFCVRCLAVDANKPCTKCGRLGSSLNKTTDALIVAHAAILTTRKSVTTLYTLDGGPLHLGTGLPKKGYTLNVTRPPSPSGPLFPLPP
jgi:hypothetical protein